MSRRVTKYCPGAPYRTLAEVIEDVEAGCYLYMRHKPQHPRVIENMTIATLRAFLRNGHLYRALRVGISKDPLAVKGPK